MGVLLLILDEDYKSIKRIGIINEDNIRMISKSALEVNLPCLSFVDYVGDTIFNEKQLINIKKELKVLRLNKSLDAKSLNLIEKGVDFALFEPFYYLCFQGD